MLARIVALVGAVLLLGGCKDGSSSGPRPGVSAQAASASASGGDDDLLPAIELKAPKPRYALTDLTDKQLERIVARAGWTPTVVGRTPPSEGQSTIRVAGIKKAEGAQLEAAVLVRCKKQDDKPPQPQRGEAFYKDGNCTVVATVHLGIRNKSAESQRLLEAVLAGSTD